MSLDIPMVDAPEAQADAIPSEPKLVILTIDFGTSNTAQQYVVLEPHEIEDRTEVSPTRIRAITNYDEDLYNPTYDLMRNEVPTSILYPPDPDFRQSDPRFGNEDVDWDGDYRNWALFGYEVDGLHESADDRPRQGKKLPMTEERVDSFKLLFQDDEATQEVRDKLEPIIQRLQDTRIIPRGAPQVAITADFFTRLLSHTKYQLKSREGLEDNYKIEVVLCVPVVFRLAACMDLQKALAKALCRVKLGGLDCSEDYIPRFSMITEPEAGAEWALKQYEDIERESRILILDSGGGTSDTSLYQTGASLPLRLAREDAPPTGDLCGSNILNGMFYKEVLRRLEKGAPQLATTRGTTLSEIAREITWEQFEQKKRGFDMKAPRQAFTLYKCVGLASSKEHNFAKNMLRVPHDVISDMFETCLQKVWNLAVKQLDEAREREKPVNTIIMMGGFSRSVSYQNFIQEHVNEYNLTYKAKIKLLGVAPDPIDPTAIAQGAALRALNQAAEPARALPLSYGILRHIEDHEMAVDHRYLPPKIHRGRSKYTQLDDKWWFFDRIVWFAQKGENVDENWSFSIGCEHVFRHSAPKLLCEELIYMSDRIMESGYSKENKRNKGCPCIGTIVADMTSLRDERVILPEQNGPKTCWRVSFDLVIRVKGLNLEAEARFRGEKKGHCIINMAPAIVARKK
ncbi:hypothetical protein PG985_011001 [Apiospora marii]|uniref:Uncharacterized protein n=1 Tax=Apiospora marii TaxID=335849 RepID=A0ABR1SSG8_9PEZI